MRNKDFEASAKRLLAGDITFDAFAAVTATIWTGLARYLLKRWPAPHWYTYEDCEQELLLGAWQAVWRYDAARGAPLGRYLVFNACAKAKKRLHSARGVNQSDDKELATFWEIPVTVFDREEDGENRLDGLLIELPVQEDNSDKQARLRGAAAALEGHELLALRALAQSDTIDEAARLVRTWGVPRASAMSATLGAAEAVARLDMTG